MCYAECVPACGVDLRVCACCGEDDWLSADLEVYATEHGRPYDAPTLSALPAASSRIAVSSCST